MQTKKGSYRFVIFGKKRVYKFPALRYFLGVVKSMPKMLIHGDGKFIPQELSWGFRNFMRGIRENKSEYRCWKRMHTPFLVPTYFSVLGFCNIQKREHGEEPSREELGRLFSRLPEAARQDLARVESHCLEPGNFIKIPNGLALVDYDNGTTPAADKYPFTIFLERWHAELNSIFLPKIS